MSARTLTKEKFQERLLRIDQAASALGEFATQKELAERAGMSVPVMRRMQWCGGVFENWQACMRDRQWESMRHEPRTEKTLHKCTRCKRPITEYQSYQITATGYFHLDTSVCRKNKRRNGNGK